MSQPNLIIHGIPKNIPDTVAAIARSRMLKAVGELLEDAQLQDITITVSTSSLKPPIKQNSPVNNKDNKGDELSLEERAKQYESQPPLYTLEQLVISEELRQQIIYAVDSIRVQSLVYDKWGLRKIEPFPRTALNFYGEPGTGKTLGAHAIAHRLNKPILIASYAQIESKYLGEGSKNVEALFYAAKRDNAVLFIDEADSLLSKRITEVTQGSERAANSICSQLLICLEKFEGVVIFATNLVENYDKAFETRVKYIHFPLPNENARQAIWNVHLVPELPLASDVSIEELAKLDNLCGRDIKNAVISAANSAALEDKNSVSLEYFLKAVEQIKASKTITKTVETKPLDAETEAKIRAALAKKEQAENEAKFAQNGHVKSEDE
jgi:SpoVK/Ycf46/Vps4 family AAA+-type ATPase